MADLFAPLSFARGPGMPNRMMLAPLTNFQSHEDGRLSDEEYHWLVKRAIGGFGLTMTCAAHVQAQGKGFPGQLGVFSDDHLEGLTRLAAAINAQGGLSALQLHHAGIRAPRAFVAVPVGASDDAETGARALSTGEVEQLVEDFVAAAVRCERAGFHGVEVHGAHGYIIAQFLSAQTNRRTDRYGGTLENRARLMFEIIDGIRARCRPDFQVGLRLSPERYGMVLAEACDVAQQAMRGGQIDYLDMSLWDAFKEPVEEQHKGRRLMDYFTELDRGAVRLGVAGKIRSAAAAREILDNGADYVLIGRAGIVHHDFPRLASNPDFVQAALPVSAQHLADEGVSPRFVEYLRTTFAMVEG